ncbi:MAG TPA: hypothetical protein VHZ55_07190 [Bryobacteraceae bacterium]|nr:hypothetical protein [Bryobacteraceae bacterium]
MAVDFSGRWRGEVPVDEFFRVTSFTLLVTIEHLEPLLQRTTVMSAPGYGLQHLLMNYLTTGSEVVRVTHGMTIRTQAHWEGRELVLNTDIQMGRYQQRVVARWRLRGRGKILTMQIERNGKKNTISLGRCNG